jgi:hypothetical protein
MSSGSQSRRSLRPYVNCAKISQTPFGYLGGQVIGIMVYAALTGVRVYVQHRDTQDGPAKHREYRFPRDSVVTANFCVSSMPFTVRKPHWAFGASSLQTGCPAPTVSAAPCPSRTATCAPRQAARSKADPGCRARCSPYPSAGK